MSAEAVQAVVDLGGEQVARLLERVEQRMEELAVGHGPPLSRHAAQTIAAGGKRLRPLLVCLAAGAPPPETDGLLRAAVAVELVHGATLIHDDVLDGSSLRRGRPTVFAAGGRAMATATGDLLFSRAFAELAVDPLGRRGADAVTCQQRARRGGADAARRRLRHRPSAPSATSSAAG